MKHPAGNIYDTDNSRGHPTVKACPDDCNTLATATSVFSRTSLYVDFDKSAKATSNLSSKLLLLLISTSLIGDISPEPPFGVGGTVVGLVCCDRTVCMSDVRASVAKIRIAVFCAINNNENSNDFIIVGGGSSYSRRSVNS